MSWASSSVRIGQSIVKGGPRLLLNCSRIEHQPPKLGVEGSNPSPPANSCLANFWVFLHCNHKLQEVILVSFLELKQFHRIALCTKSFILGLFIRRDADCFALLCNCNWQGIVESDFSFVRYLARSIHQLLG